jgi:hypothetical protein
VQNYLQLIALA